MAPGSPDGPAWLGIGAQRSGTTWVTDLLTQHPGVSLGRSGRKELHALNRSLDGSIDEPAYLAEFAGLDTLAGEFTPGYLRMPWVAPVALRLCRAEVAIFAVLRDPIDRYASAMRLYKSRFPVPDTSNPEAVANWARLTGVEVTWGGLYATQLDIWAHWFGRDRIHLLQYEAVVADPQSSVAQWWRALGLDEVELTRVETLSDNTITDRTLWRLADQGPGLLDTLNVLYRPEVDRLVNDWGFDRRLWPSF